MTLYRICISLHILALCLWLGHMFVWSLIIGPALVYFQVGLDIMWTGLIAGTISYAVHRLRGAAA